MSLEIVTQKLGLWHDPSWTQGMPGVYALVIGVSAYALFEGGETAAPESYGLGQLVSSATTAAKVFDWLRDSFLRENLPVVWCWLMLSPTTKEREVFEKDGLTHYCEPTYDNLRMAISTWTGIIPNQSPASDVSRSFFFFSGHGVQSNRKAALLPSNYLDTTMGNPDLQNCIGVPDLKDWMEESPVAEHIALLDACRNEFAPLAFKGANAHPLFPANDSSSKGPRAVATLQATSPNAIAYQFEGLPYTFFGQAVLDGLAGLAVSRNSSLEFNEFFDYVKQRVNTLLKDAAKVPLEQSARKSTEGGDNLIVTEFKLQVIPEAPGIRGIDMAGETGGILPLDYAAQYPALIVDPAAPGIRGHVKNMITGSGQISAPVPASEGSLSSQSQIREALRLRFDDALEVSDCIPFAALVDGSNGEAHRRFGHEYASLVWVNGRAELYSLEDRQPCPDGATIHRVKRNDDSSIIQVDLALKPRSGGVLLVFQDSTFVERERLAMKLPTDYKEKVPIRLTLTIERAGAKSFPKLQNIEGRLGPCNWNKYYDYLWGLSREADLGSLRKAAERADTNQLKNAAYQKLQAETAATAGMLLLAEAGTIAEVEDWPRNLMEWFPLIPDGAVLWAQALRDALARKGGQPYGVTNPIEEMLAALEVVSKRGVPFFAESLELADSMVRYIQRADLTNAQRERLNTVAQWIDMAMAVTVPAGHFLLVPGLPRPEGMPGGPGAFKVAEILDLLHGLN
jgi:hypothetical protein